MEKIGIYMVGLFTDFESFTKKDTGEASFRVTVATGRYSYSVYMVPETDAAILQGLNMGQIIKVKARPYSGKNGLAWSDGELIDF